MSVREKGTHLSRLGERSQNCPRRGDSLVRSKSRRTSAHFQAGRRERNLSSLIRPHSEGNASGTLRLACARGNLRPLPPPLLPYPRGREIVSTQRPSTIRPFIRALPAMRYDRPSIIHCPRLGSRGRRVCIKSPRAGAVRDVHCHWPRTAARNSAERPLIVEQSAAR